MATNGRPFGNQHLQLDTRRPLNGAPTMEATRLLFTVTETASLLSLGRSKTYELVRAGVIPSVRITGSRRIKASDLKIYVAGLREAAS
jgi:excisionase family DNA binding protein